MPRKTPLPLVLCPSREIANRNPLVILIDCSYSMSEVIAGSPAYQHARKTLETLQEQNAHCLIYGFSNSIVQLSCIADIKPTGSTRLLATLTRAARHNPRKIIIITDGYINDDLQCREVILAHLLDIDGIFIGNSLAALESLRTMIAPGTVDAITADALPGVTLMLANKTI
jgi:hypothetical protein